jgi:galactan 5-O-arabinofuranosyltransferase
VVLGVYVVAVRTNADPFSPRVRYGLHVAPLVVAALALCATWLARRRKRSWDADLIPALFGGLGAVTILVSLQGTPFDTAAIIGDQSFRTAAITRFAQSWWGGDYTYEDLPAYYAPTFFWVLGRAADLTGTEPWRMLKYGTVAVAFLAPIVSYLLWRRIVPARVAAVIAAVPLVLPGLDETYAWLVRSAFLAWWLEVGHGLGRPNPRWRTTVALGLVGGLMFTVYYYFFFLIPFALLISAGYARWRGTFDWRGLRRTFATLGIAAATAAPFWAPRAWNFLTAPEFESLNNRWMTLSSGRLLLPMLEPSVIGVLCLAGLVHLVLTFDEPLSRALLFLLVAMYVWHGVGFLFVAVDQPLMSFRMRELVPVALLAAAALAMARMLKWAVGAFPPIAVWRLATVGAVVLAVFAGDRFVTHVVDNQRVREAHNHVLPNGKLPVFHEDGLKPSTSPVEAIRDAIDAQYRGSGLPVVFTDRSDLLSLYPYYGFVQWNANYSHPTSRFHDRLDYLTDLTRSTDPADFANRVRDNPYDDIDVLVLRTSGTDKLVFRVRDDDFPYGTKVREFTFPRSLVRPEHFTITTVGEYLVATVR